MLTAMLGTWREQHLPQIVANLANRPGHESVRTMVADILRYGFNVDYHQIDHEVRLPEVHGRADQRHPLALLNSEEIGITLAEEDQLDPEQSTSVIVVHHSQAKYFSV
jgi:5-methyltetrahydrofolate--homocysteine methyltransferase